MFEVILLFPYIEVSTLDPFSLRERLESPQDITSSSELITCISHDLLIELIEFNWSSLSLIIYFFIR